MNKKIIIIVFFMITSFEVANSIESTNPPASSSNHLSPYISIVGHLARNCFCVRILENRALNLADVVDEIISVIEHVMPTKRYPNIISFISLPLEEQDILRRYIEYYVMFYMIFLSYTLS